MSLQRMGPITLPVQKPEIQKHCVISQTISLVISEHEVILPTHGPAASHWQSSSQEASVRRLQSVGLPVQACPQEQPRCRRQLDSEVTAVQS